MKATLTPAIALSFTNARDNYGKISLNSIAVIEKVTIFAVGKQGSGLYGIPSFAADKTRKKI